MRKPAGIAMRRMPKRAEGLADHLWSIVIMVVSGLLYGLLGLWNKRTDERVEALAAEDVKIHSALSAEDAKIQAALAAEDAKLANANREIQSDMNRLFESNDLIQRELASIKANHNSLKELALERHQQTNRALEEIARKLDRVLERLTQGDRNADRHTTGAD